jgi:hypothetical protein
VGVQLNAYRLLILLTAFFRVFWSPARWHILLQQSSGSKTAALPLPKPTLRGNSALTRMPVIGN